MKNFSDYITVYKEQLQKEDIQKAYEGLVKYVMALKSHFSKRLSDEFLFGNISPGYMDFTYFPFFNDFLREQKLRFGIVLNHKKVRFELWLMGQNLEIQKNYWNLLKTSPWNKEQIAMPKYSVLEVILVENPDFNELDILTSKIEQEAIILVHEIIDYIKHSSTFK
ncbi:MULTISPECIES: DUF7000 family protein [unclassified Dysgonomonas]|uniref:DUF7000 family protein n=1 Tax=unclassified Dysgonomonas TaxID=2630389 RepID=UPI00068228B8|nr:MULTISPECIES: hypothetical protein [unclassified Dysgonomonas]MBD8348259.1 hypothetical protein [Dysgonomonas sp. HGC4]MBF0575763.1 hypothetical protein [Dysgonomonas sp. GY617]